MQENSPPAMPNDAETQSPGSVGGSIARLAQELRELAHDHLELVALETRLSINTALKMAIIAVITAIALVSTWLALVASAVLGLIEIGLEPVIAILLLAGANLVLAIAGWWTIRHKSHSLGWPATQRAINPSPKAEPESVVT